MKGCERAWKGDEGKRDCGFGIAMMGEEKVGWIGWDGMGWDGMGCVVMGWDVW